ncbi:MAG: septum formation initiator family protein [Longimicrobiales bacterium]
MGRLKRLVLPAVLLLAGYYAVFGGEYSFLELYRARQAEQREAAQLAEMHRQLDSLRAWADSLEVDSATLERIARERFGMIRDGEILYRIVDVDTVPDSAGAR